MSKSEQYKKRYAKNKDKRKEYNKKRRENNKELNKEIKFNWTVNQYLWLLKYTNDKFWDDQWIIKCSKCWCNITWVMNWHHTDPTIKETNVCNIKKIDNIIKEIEDKKCIPLCLSCHLIEHLSWPKLKALYLMYKDNLNILPPVLKEKIQCRAMNNLNNLITRPDETEWEEDAS